MYWESGRSAAAAAGQASPQISLPVASTVFRGEIFPGPAQLAGMACPNLIYFHEAARAATSPPGSGHSYFPKIFARASGRSAR